MTSAPEGAGPESPWIEACEREPIHLPGAVQAWGALLVANQADLVVQHASANLAGFIGCGAEAAIGQKLTALLDPSAVAPLLNGAVGAQVPGTVAAVLHRPAGWWMP
jgi:light-regulated signal transduction histidine kinase (bacteriophytochrome)